MWTFLYVKYIKVEFYNLLLGNWFQFQLIQILGMNLIEKNLNLKD